MNYFPGQIDTFLNDEGIKQAQLVGSKLCDEDFSHVFSSDLQRARKVSDYCTGLLLVNLLRG